jgi:hypothetical protein
MCKLMCSAALRAVYPASYCLLVCTAVALLQESIDSITSTEALLVCYMLYAIC